MKKDNHTEEIIFLGILIIPVIWIALLIAPFIHKDYLMQWMIFLMHLIILFLLHGVVIPYEL